MGSPSTQTEAMLDTLNTDNIPMPVPVDGTLSTGTGRVSPPMSPSPNTVRKRFSYRRIFRRWSLPGHPSPAGSPGRTGTPHTAPTEVSRNDNGRQSDVNSTSTNVPVRRRFRSLVLCKHVPNEMAGGPPDIDNMDTSTPTGAISLIRTLPIHKPERTGVSATHTNSYPPSPHTYAQMRRTGKVSGETYTATSDDAYGSDTFLSAASSDEEEETKNKKRHDVHHHPPPQSVICDTALLADVSKSLDPIQRMSLPSHKPEEISLLKILKHLVGKDLTRITMPIFLNEPLTFLQRITEDFRYHKLLSYAANLENEAERLCFVSAFTATPYASTLGRFFKSFNPILGETFGLDKFGIRLHCEQVSHHPPITAFHCEGKDGKFTVWGQCEVSTSLALNSLTVTALGTTYLELRTPNGPEVYSWTRPQMEVHNVMWGSLWLEWSGRSTIKNHKTGSECQLKFESTGWWGSGNLHSISGEVYTVDSHISQYTIGGQWNEELWIRRNLSTRPHKQSDFLKYDGIPICIFKPENRDICTDDYFSMTPLALQLNIPVSITDRDMYPPTDSRFRPDQRQYENGELDAAQEEKHRLETKQRKARQDRKTAWKPCWFQKKLCFGEEIWLSNRTYWKTAATRGPYESSPDIF